MLITPLVSPDQYENIGLINRDRMEMEREYAPLHGSEVRADSLKSNPEDQGVSYGRNASDTASISPEAREMQRAAASEKQREQASGDSENASANSADENLNGSSISQSGTESASDTAKQRVAQLQKQIQEVQKNLQQANNTLQQAIAEARSGMEAAAQGGAARGNMSGAESSAPQGAGQNAEQSSDVKEQRLIIGQLNNQLASLNEQLQKAMKEAMGNTTAGPVGTRAQGWK